MKKQLVLGVIVLTLLMTALAIVPSPNAHTQSDPYVTDLIAGQHYVAGTVSVWNDGSYIYVIYQTTGGWELTGTNLYVGKTDPATLTSAPGQFPYSTPYQSSATRHEYKIALSVIDGYHLKNGHSGKWVANGTLGVGPGDKVYIAAHAGVCGEIPVSGGLEELDAGLPEQVNVLATHSYPTYDQSYFQVTISGGTSLDGAYNGWCIDTYHNMSTEQYLANVYSSNGIIPPLAYLYHPENLDLLNYILNQHYIGKSSACGGVYTFGDVQRAIWTLFDPDYVPLVSMLGPSKLCRVNEIVADATAHGENFVPGCGQVLAVILDPTEIVWPVGQLAIIEVPITCGYETHCETAWGNGIQFPSPNWAMYFEYTIQ